MAHSKTNPMPDSLDYTPQQALSDAADRVQKEDFDCAIIILAKKTQSGTPSLSHFASGVYGLDAVALLEVLKTNYVLGILS